MKQGEICLLELIFTDHSASKLRPALVISRTEFNDDQDVIVLPISSSAARSGDATCREILSSAPWFSQTGLKQSSHVKWSKPVTVAKSLIKRRLGTLPAAEVEKILLNVVSLYYSASLP